LLLSLPTAAYLEQRGLTPAGLPHTTAQCHLTILGEAVLFRLNHRSFSLQNGSVFELRDAWFHVPMLLSDDTIKRLLYIGERISKVGQYLFKLWQTLNDRVLFLTTSRSRYFVYGTTFVYSLLSGLLLCHPHHHWQPWAQRPLVSDAIVTIAAHRCLSRAAWLNSCRVAPHHCWCAESKSVQTFQAAKCSFIFLLLLRPRWRIVSWQRHASREAGGRAMFENPFISPSSDREDQRCSWKELVCRQGWNCRSDQC